MAFRTLVAGAPVAYLIHILEEAPGFVEWAHRYPALFAPSFDQKVFLVTNVIFMSIMLVAVLYCLRSSVVVAGLAVAAWEFSNAMFHIAFTVGSGIYSPGTISAVALYLPLSIAIFSRARAEGLLTFPRAAWALFLGAFVANLPLRLLQAWLAMS